MREDSDMVVATKWIDKVIDSCETDEHVESCKRLIDNFHKIHGFRALTSSLHTCLEIRVIDLQLKELDNIDNFLFG